MSKLKESPLFWPATLKSGIMSVLDETQVPKKMHYVKVKTLKGAVDVIHDMKTRAFGQFLVVLYTFLMELDKVKAVKKNDFKGQQKVLDMIKKIAHDLLKLGNTHIGVCQNSFFCATNLFDHIPTKMTVFPTIQPRTINIC